VLVLRN